MSSQESPVYLVKQIYEKSFQFLLKNPTFFVPFIIFLVCEFTAFVLLYLAPRVPLRTILGPPIRTLWGERFLHYPANFFLLPKLVSNARMGLSVLVGSLLTGMAIAIILDVYRNRRLNLGRSFKVASSKYVSLFTIVLLFTAGFYIFTKVLTIGLTKYFLAGHNKLLFIGPKLWLGPIFIIINFVVAILIQAAFIYAIPAVIIDNKRLHQAIGSSFGLFGKIFIPTIILVGLPMLLYVPIIILNANKLFLINKLCPEFILFVVGLSIVIGTLIIDPLITMSVTLLYLEKKNKG